MTPTPTDRVRQALRDLCTRAGAGPDDSSPDASRAVLAVLARDKCPLGAKPVADEDVGLQRWLTEACEFRGSAHDDGPYLVAMTTRALVFGAGARGARPREYVGYPACVAAAVKAAHGGANRGAA